MYSGMEHSILLQPEVSSGSRDPILTSQNLNIVIRAVLGRKERFQHLSKLTPEKKDMTYPQLSDACYLEKKRLVSKRKTLTLWEKSSF